MKNIQVLIAIKQMKLRNLDEQIWMLMTKRADEQEKLAKLYERRNKQLRQSTGVR